MMNDLFEDSLLLNGHIDFLADWLPVEESNALFNRLLSDTRWEQPSLMLYGKEHPIPRLQSWLGDDEYRYRYSGKDFVSERWPQSLAELARRISDAADCQFNSVLINLYRDGHDSMGWHADDEPELGKEPVIASLSLGATRDFALRPTGSTRQAARIPLTHGSLMIMKAGMQTHWQHSIPRRARVQDARINLTFRRLIVP